jgi:tRNA threonylcarbamoyladenosine biosynthesis protein TsaE
MQYELISNKEETTIKVGQIIGTHLERGTILTLTGDLGAGKTMFAKGIARGVGVKEHITSPTYTIVQEYNGRMPLYHFDTYRILDCDEMYDIGFDDYLYGDGICIIEWPQRVKELLPPTCIDIRIERVNEEESRKIIIQLKDGNKCVICEKICQELREEGLHVIEKKH